ncbi:hypothetical protein SxD43FB_07870 [Sphingobium sp. D43FB]|nr:hypothetical protein SxD43FB_07870 [Sphingobium sp. D43FB]
MTGKSRNHVRSLRHIFGAPLIIALLSLVGLVSALAGDGAADWLSWAALLVPPLAVVWAMRKHRR